MSNFQGKIRYWQSGLDTFMDLEINYQSGFIDNENDCYSTVCDRLYDERILM